jgi:DNA-binding NtrC family response regulator
MPPLRQHREDIPLLASRILSQLDGPTRMLAPDAVAYLLHQAWPGNVRELRNMVRRAAALSEGTVLSPESFERLEQVRPSSRPPPGGPSLSQAALPPLTQVPSLRALRRHTERDYLGQLLALYAGDLDRAAGHAGIHRKSLERLLRQHGLGRRP